MAIIKIPIQVSGIKAMKKWMDDHVPVQLPDESDEHHAGYVECYEHFRNALDKMDEDEE